MGTYKGYMDVWSLWEGDIVMRATLEDMTCKYCGSTNIVKYGHFKNTQQWWCKDCQRKFADNKALPHMKTPIEQIAAALGMYYEGMSLNAVRRQLNQIYGNYPSDSTVYEWITRFTKKAVSYAAGLNCSHSIVHNEEYVRGQAELIRDMVRWGSESPNTEEIISDIEQKVLNND